MGRAKISILNIIAYLILILWAISTISPFLWVINNSFKTTSEILLNSLGFPKELSFRNYQQLGNYGNINMFKGFLNSFIISGSVVLLVLFISSLASFVLSRFDFKINNTFKSLATAAMLVPTFSIVIPALVLVRKLGISGSYLSLILPQTALNLPFAILVLSSFMITLPKELEESALIDGANFLTILFKILLPLSIPGIVTVAIFVFLWSYNDLFMSMIFIPIREKQPICVLLSLVSSIYGTNYGAMMSALVITIIPVLILYMSLQEFVIKGLTAGAIKG